MNKDRGFLSPPIHLFAQKAPNRKDKERVKGRKSGGEIQEKDLGVLVPNQCPFGCASYQRGVVPELARQALINSRVTSQRTEGLSAGPLGEEQIGS